jgi:hypothetical protein
MLLSIGASLRHGLNADPIWHFLFAWGTNRILAEFDSGRLIIRGAGGFSLLSDGPLRMKRLSSKIVGLPEEAAILIGLGKGVDPNGRKSRSRVHRIRL